MPIYSSHLKQPIIIKPETLHGILMFTALQNEVQEKFPLRWLGLRVTASRTRMKIKGSHTGILEQKKVSSTNGARKNGCPHAEELNETSINQCL